MKIILSKCLVLILAGMAFPALAQTQTQTTPPTSSQPQSQSQAPADKPALVASEAVTEKATVQDVNPKRRLVILKDPEGRTIRLKFKKDEAQALSELHKGDVVTAKYYESTAVALAKPGEEPTGLEQESFVVAPENGTAPGRVLVNSFQTTATVEKIDPQKRRIVLKEPDGKTVKLKVDKSVQNLDQIKPGDKIVVRYTEAAEVSIAKSHA